MEAERVDQGIARSSARIYLPISFTAALLFLVAASIFGNHTLVARAGGAVWVGLLSLIVSMPLVTARVKKRIRAGETHN